ncbi:Gfo/Idh/MocA family protein [Labedaea rhizosphaerae]|uniref:Putative dehydrogenase n=1 Tax=Labedaea rhizosphaerae TaxID=598644 RepID=A0A4R6S4Y9_LABRH|nr:Gfo/Idh/MocA family oxidoreductase [Labedaea rhizosphaerae]TDP94839.1 putative dehydrogenase [Labedaea rhizosphaerae]
MTQESFRGTRPARSELRVGVVGTGIMGKANAATIASHPAVRVTALTNRTQSSAEELAGKLHADGHDRPTVYSGLDELLAAGVVDALVIATPDHLHADAMVAGAAAGVDLLVEKPFTTDVDQADRAVEAIRSAGVVAMCLFNHRWVPAYAQAYALSADLGEAVVGHTRKNDTLFVPTEMIKWAAGTTCAWFLSSHDIDLVSWLYRDTVVEVFASARSGVLTAMGIDTPDAMQIQCRYSRGAVATFESCWIYPNTFPTVTDSFVEAVFEKGVTQLDRQVENITIATESAFQYPRNALQRNLHGQPSGAYRDAVFHFVDCALTGRQPLIDVASSRHVTAVLAAAHESAKRGVPIPVAPAP